MSATLRGNLPICKTLSRSGCNINGRYACGCTPLSFACANGKWDIAEYLVSLATVVNSASCKAEGLPGYPAHHYTSYAGQSELLKSLLDKEPVASSTLEECFQFAAYRGYEQCLEVLYLYREAAKPVVESGGDGEPPTIVTLQDPEGSARWSILLGTALDAAAGQGMLRATKYLLEIGADIETRDHDWNTPLLTAVINEELYTAELLLLSGANVNACGGDGRSALLLSVEHGGVPMVRLLMKFNADITLPNANGSSALHMSFCGTYDEDLIEYLIAKGCDFSALDSYGNTPLQLAIRNQKVSDDFIMTHLPQEVHVSSKVFGTLLNVACDYGRKPVVVELLKRVQECEVREYVNRPSAGGTPLYAATKRCRTEVMKVLIDAGADVNATGGQLGSALMVACTKGHIESVRMLLQHGAELHWQGSNGTCVTAKSAARLHPDKLLLLARHEDPFLGDLDDPLPTRKADISNIEENYKRIVELKERKEKEEEEQEKEKSSDDQDEENEEFEETLSMLKRYSLRT